MMQHVILIYDIPNDRLRSKVAEVCMDYGLDRIQFSAFNGRLSRNHQEELILRIRNVLKRSAGKIQLVPIAEREWQARLEIAHD